MDWLFRDEFIVLRSKYFFENNVRIHWSFLASREVHTSRIRGVNNRSTFWTITYFFYKKMRTDSLIIFSVRRSSYESNSRGKQSKYFLKITCFAKRCARIHWSFLACREVHTYRIRGVNNRNTFWKITYFCKKMRTDSLIIFSVQRSSYESNSRGKQSKYFLKNNMMLVV